MNQRPGIALESAFAELESVTVVEGLNALEIELIHPREYKPNVKGLPFW